MAKYEVAYSKHYKKDIKKISKKDIEAIEKIIERLANNETLEPKYKDHALGGQLKGCRDCHIKPDLVLIYKKQENVLVLTCVRVGSHNELF
ncbi:type II toxin-antitoxin system YafQ family toxin [Helicobacter sp. 11S02596-1]|uniref:type II toxin-antitoxin system YafQ family toxin n=1 Tax=Helicobacter sp. 11S02596-1 TaxID=1476194 RepID=UPI000BA67BCD|nr:type II toxin-antitoxin system YafQ family toxin [Helicobacter sp. 11S02596-1]PAF41200.1 addiction module toxin RelE [Helicobacter sp. 11S02596-1]